MRFGVYSGRAWLKGIGVVTAVICTAAVITACGTTKATQLSKAPAEHLNLSIRYSNSLFTSTQIIINVRITDTSGEEVTFSKNQTMTINGIPGEKPSSQELSGAYNFLVPPAPPGGSYTLVYTDELGQQTKVVIPAPLRDLAIVSPAADAHVPIPQPVATSGPSLTVRFTAPFDEATLPVPISKHEQRPPYEAVVYGSCKTRGDNGTPTTDPLCARISGTQNIGADGILVVDNPNDPPAYRFSNLAPGPGTISVDALVVLLVPPGRFHSLYVAFSNETVIPVTWV